MTKRGRPKHPELLTPREQEVLALLREGLTNPQIAERLGIGLEGVKYHVSEILSKLHVSTRDEAARWRGDRPWWLGALAFWRPPLRAASIAAASGVLVAAAVGLVLLAVLLWRSGDGEARPEAGEFQSVYFVDKQHGWVSGVINGRGVILSTTNGGETWLRQVEHGMDDMQFVDPLTGWGIAHGATGRDVDPDVLLHTIDGGVSWDIQYKFTGRTTIEFISVSLGRALVNGKLMESWDGGTTWNPVPTSVELSSVCFGDANAGFGAADGKILRTDDGGLTWATTEGTGMELRCSGAQDAWVRSPGPLVGGTIVDYVLWHTADGGTHWNPVLGHQSIGPLADAVLTDPGPQPGPWAIGDSEDAYFVGRCMPCETSTLVATHDAGASWSAPVELADLRRAASLSFPDESHGWAVGATIDDHWIYPVILATTDGGVTWEQQYP